MAIAAVLAVVEFGVFLTWMGVYLARWQSWGAAGDTLNVITLQG
jgi:hypothetical protein